MDLDIGFLFDRQYRTIRNLTIALIVALMVIVVNNVAWMWLFNQYDYETTTTTTTTTEWEVVQDGEGQNTIDGSFNGGY